MLIQRVITALFMLAILLPAIFYNSLVPFGIVTLLLISAGGWEWARLNQFPNRIAVVVGVVCAGVFAASWQYGWTARPMGLLWLIVGSSWILVGVRLLNTGVSSWSVVPKGIRLIGGLFAIWIAWLAVMQARLIGVNFLFSVMVLVWVADIFAYFFGRALGGKWIAQKLAPSISPGKTWEGAIGGLLGVVAIAFIWKWADSTFELDSKSIYTMLYTQHSWLMAVAVVLLGVMSVVGDLLESLFKRSAGVKDSSGLLPGHGGVLDRVDALLPVLPLAMMLVTL
jgi:phosphatidate cytidylyltransferase